MDEDMKEYGLTILKGVGEKSKIVEEWKQQHPDGKKIDCERETGLSRHTVLKWWK